jgi:1,4-dihydroxy-2-naphthoate octaprenyltransferase
MGVKPWIKAMRLRTLPLAASCVFAGAACSMYQSPYPWKIFGLALFTTVLLQILSNFANDYGDFAKGTDNENRVGPQRALQSGAITAGQMKVAIIINVVLALMSGITLLWVSYEATQETLGLWILLGIGVLSIAAAYKYTAGDNAYGYSGLGDISVFLFFGLVGVMGNAYLYRGDFTPDSIFPAIGVGCLSTAVLNLNNLRDHVNDAASGKRTRVVKMGFSKGKEYQLWLILIGANFALLSVFVLAKSWYHYLPILALVPLVIHAKKVMRTENPADLDPELKKVALVTFAFSLLLWLTQVVVG